MAILVRNVEHNGSIMRYIGELLEMPESILGEKISIIDSSLDSRETSY